MNGAQLHFGDVCPIPAALPKKPRKPRRTVHAEPPRYTGDARARVLAYIKDTGTFGATDEEVQIQLAMGGNTQRPRRVELLRAQQIKDSGKTRRTLAGITAVVWVDASVEVPKQ